MDDTIKMQEMKKILNSLPGGIGLYHVYPDGRIELVYLNDDYYEWSGFTREERAAFDGGTTIKAIHPDDRAKVQAAAVEACSSHQVQNIVCRIMLPENKCHWVNIRVKSIAKEEDYYSVYALYSDVNELICARQEMKEACRKAQEREASLQTMLDHMPGALVVFEVRHKMLYLRYISDGCEKISGFTAEETYAKHSVDPLTDAHPDSKDFFREHEWDDIQAGQAINYSYQIICKDGTYKWVSLNLSPVQIDHEILYYGVFRDLDADELAKVQKQNHYDQLVEIMENMNDENLVARARLDLNVNRVLYYMHRGFDGRQIAEERPVDVVLAAVLQSIVLPETKKEMQEKLTRAALSSDFIKGKETGSYTYQRVNNSGSTLWYELKYRLMLNPIDQHIVAFFYIYDISERILEDNMMSKLGETEYDVLGLIDAKTEVFESKRVRGVKSLASSNNIYLKGRFADVVCHQILATVAEAEQTELEAKMEVDYICQQLATQDSYQVSFFAYRKNHECRRKKMNFCYLDDTKAYIFYYCTDITEAFNKEQQQLRITEEALEQARRANVSKTEFFSQMSHDMRTPMNGILGLTDLSEDERDIDVLHENIRRIHDSGQYLLSLINDTLDFQRIESGKMVLEKQIVNTRAVLGGIVDVVRPSMEKKKLHFNVINENADLDWYIKLDAIRFKQIFINLLSNAIKFTPEGGTVTFLFGCTGREGMISHDYIRVSDTGIGMSESFVKNDIFKPFAQERNPISAQSAGSGLGLSIVKNLVGLMGGRIEVESALGKGTTFTIFIDFECVEKEMADRQLSKEKEQISGAKEQLLGKHALLVEDHPLNAEIAKKLLEKAGCTVEIAENGQLAVEAVKRAEADDYDFILMDIRMPVMNGLDATRAIRAMDCDWTKQIPIVAMTANAFAEDVKVCIDAGMNGHISKPIEPVVMYRTIADILA